MIRSAPTLVGNALPYNNIIPTQVNSTSWNQISAAGNYSIALSSNNLLYTWGTNTVNQLGDGTTINKSSPVQIGTASWSLISGGFDHAVAINPSNQLYTWGNNLSTLVPTYTFFWTAISAGDGHTLAIRNDNTLWAWGLNNLGQLGDNTSVWKSSPVQLGSGSWSSVSAGAGN